MTAEHVVRRCGAGVSCDLCGGICSAELLERGPHGTNCDHGHVTDPVTVPGRPGVVVQPLLVSGAVRTRLADVTEEQVRWLWPLRIPIGKVTLIEGDPGLGKSVLTLDIAARVSTGAAMPDGSPSELRGPSGVVLLSAEDGLGDTIKPRLMAAGADTSRIAALTGIADIAARDLPRLPTLADLGAIREVAAEVGARLVIVDPLMAYMPREFDSNHDQDVRAVLAGLATLAADMDAAVVLVRHLNKREGGRALYRGGGSIGIVGGARSALLVAKDPDDDDRRILAPQKANLSALAPSLTYRLAVAGASVRVEWEGASERTAEELLGEASGVEQSATDRAFVWLLQALGTGARAAKDVEQEGLEHDAAFSRKVLRKARERLGIKPHQRRNGWYWSLPSDAQLQLGDPLMPPNPDPDAQMPSHAHRASGHLGRSGGRNRPGLAVSHGGGAAGGRS